MRQVTESYLNDSSVLPRSGPPFSSKLSLVTWNDLRDNVSMVSELTTLFLLTGSFNAVTIATIMYTGFPRPETRFTLVVTLLLVYALLALAPLVQFSLSCDLS